MTSADKTPAPDASDQGPEVAAAGQGAAPQVDSQAALHGRLWIALAAVMWSMSGLFAKAPLFESWPSETRGVALAFWRALFAGLLLLPAVRKPQWDRKLIPLCLMFTSMNVTYLSAMSLTTAANAIWLQSTAPWWVLFVGVVLLGQPFPRAEVLPLVLGGLGLSIILWFQIQGQAQAGVILGLVSGMTYAMVVVFLRALRQLDSVWLIVVTHLVTATILAPYVTYLDQWPTATQWPVLAAFGLLQMALPYVFFARGLRSVTSQEATGIGLLEPLLLPVWVYLAWSEEPDTSTLVGGALILTGLALRYGLPMLLRRANSK